MYWFKYKLRRFIFLRFSAPSQTLHITNFLLYVAIFQNFNHYIHVQYTNIRLFNFIIIHQTFTQCHERNFYLASHKWIALMKWKHVIAVYMFKENVQYARTKYFIIIFDTFTGIVFQIFSLFHVLAPKLLQKHSFSNCLSILLI